MLALLWILVCITLGWNLTRLTPFSISKTERLIYGATLGLVIGAYIGLIASYIGDFNAASQTTALALIVVASISINFYRPHSQIRERNLFSVIPDWIRDPGMIFRKWMLNRSSMSAIHRGGFLRILSSQVKECLSLTRRHGLLLTSFPLSVVPPAVGRDSRMTKSVQHDKPKNRGRLPLLLIAIFLIIFGATTLTTRDGGIWINNSHNYGDARLHLAYITNFVQGQNIPIENPIFSGEKPSYPFLVNFLTAQLIVLGLPLVVAYNLLTVIGYLLILGMLYFVGYRVTGKKTGGVLTTFLVLASGGMGFFTLFLPGWINSGFNLDYLIHPPQDYAIFQDGGYWLGNSLLAFFNTQRTFLLGLPLTLMIILELYKTTKITKPITYLILGMLVALLPLVHASSMLVVAFLLPFFAWIMWQENKNIKACICNWILFLVPIFTLGLFLVRSYIDQTSTLSSFLRVELGWMSTTGENFVSIWLKNAPVAIALALIGIIWTWNKNRRQAIFLLSGWSLFVFANTLVTQPWNYDNSKYLLYWYIFATLAAVIVLLRIWHSRKTKAAVVLLVILLTASGTFDLLRRLQPNVNWYELVAKRDLDRFETLQTVIPPQSRVVTYGWMLNPVVSNLGRRMVFGDEAWLWSHGLDYKLRYEQIKRIYAGAPDTQALLTSLGADYLIISKEERTRAINLNEQFFIQNYSKVYSDTKNFDVYKIK